MAEFKPKVFQQIFGEMFATLVANSPITDANIGSIITTLLEAAAQEDDEQYFQMRNIILNYSLDSTSGEDLDDRAFEYGLTRREANKSTSTVTIGDSSITKISTGVFSGLPGASASETTIEGDDSTGFSASGTIIIGRDTLNEESIVYSSITQNTNSVTFNLSASLVNDHGTDETIIFSQGGIRGIPAGTGVRVPASDLNAAVAFSVDITVSILDGEEEVIDVAITADTAGSDANVPTGYISEFDSSPFSTATVTNPNRITNGKDEETDQELRDRVRETIQSLSRGTAKSITGALIGTVSDTDNKRVVSASIIEPNTIPDIVKLYIDDGTGFIPEFANTGVETVVTSATGGEQFVTADNVPVVKAFVETTSSENYDLSGTETLIVEVGGVTETIIFDSTDFGTPGDATAREVRDRLRTSQSFDARLSSGGKVRIFSRSNANDEIEVTGGTSNTILNFPTDKKFTAKLYKEDSSGNLTLLDKDGITAQIVSTTETYNFTSVPLNLVVDQANEIIQNIWLRTTDFGTPAAATAEEVVIAINNQAAGFFAELTSNNTAVRLVSSTENSSSSSIHIVENFEDVWSEESSTLVNRTTEFSDAASDIEIFATDLDYVYLGLANEKFNSIIVRLNVDSSDDLNLTMEYWNGAWITIGFSDTTTGMTGDGYILFQTPEDWIKSIADAIETDSINGYFIRLQRNTVSVSTPPTEDVIKVCGANEQLLFPTDEEVGVDKDYTFNRFIGQIELTTPLVFGDILTFGSLETRANLISSASETYDFSTNNVLNITIDSVAQTYTFVTGDFSDWTVATAAETVIAINTNFGGITASVEGDQVKLQINKWDGFFTVTGGTANTILNFSTTTQTSLTAHVGYIESGQIGPYFFEANDFIVCVVDKEVAESFLIPLYKESTLTGAVSTISVTDTTLQTVFPNSSDLVGLSLEMIDGDEAGERKRIVTYTPASGVITLESRTWISVGAVTGTEPYILMSYDANTWRKMSVAVPKNFALNGLVYGKVWITVGAADGTDAYILISTNGFNWDESSNGENLTLNDVAYDGSSIYAAVGVNGAPSTSAYIITSGDDGVVWVTRTNPKDFTLNAIIHDGATYFVTVGNSEGTNPYILTSIDVGVTWLEPTSVDAANFNLNDIASDGTTLYVTVGDSDGTDPLIYTATDPTGTWTKRNPPNKNINLNGIAYDGTALWVTVGDVDGSGPLIYSSIDPTGTWTIETVTSPKAFAINSVYWDNDNSRWMGVGVADSGDAYMITSTSTSTPMTWNEVSNPNNFSLNAVVRDSSALSGTPSASEIYQVLPSTVDEVVAFWNIRKVTNISDKTEIRDSSAGTTIQIATLAAGGDGAINITGGSANDEMAFSIVEQSGVSGYQYWTGLMQLSQWIVDGRDDDQENFPGYRAAGVQVELLEPISREISVITVVTPNEGVTLASLTDSIKSEISAYVNGLGVGDDVIVSNIICAIQDVVGVFDVSVTTPSANIAIADDELARISSTNISIS